MKILNRELLNKKYPNVNIQASIDFSNKVLIPSPANALHSKYKQSIFSQTY